MPTCQLPDLLALPHPTLPLQGALINGFYGDGTRELPLPVRPASNRGVGDWEYTQERAEGRGEETQERGVGGVERRPDAENGRRVPCKRRMLPHD